jgi:hypothetical protein
MNCCSAHLARSLRSRAQQPQRHRLHVFARHVSQEQPAQIHLRPLPLLAPGKQRGEARVVGSQLLPHVREVLRAQGHHRRSEGGEIRDWYAVSAVHHSPPATLQSPT